MLDSSRRKTTITLSVLKVIFQDVRKNIINVTKRVIFYTNVELFKKQEASDAVLHDICCMLRTTRCSLHVVAAEKEWL